MESERTTTIRLPRDAYKVFKAICSSQGLSANKVIEKLIREYSRREGKRAAQTLIANAANQ